MSMDTNTHTMQRKERPALVDWLRRFNKKATNRFTMRFAGKHVYALIHHVGRRSGKAFQTPVVAMPLGDHFYIPLPYDENVDWCRNVRAAGGCKMDWRGHSYTLTNPQVAELAEAVAAYPDWIKPLVRNTKTFLKLNRASGPDLPSYQKIRKILVYGAGVLGSLYAGKLKQAGYDVTLLARGKRLEELREQGLILVDNNSGQDESIPVTIIDQLNPEDAYDLVLVIVRKNQVPSVLPALAANQHTPNVLFMVNNAAGPHDMIQALGHERVLLGFPGAGGQRENGVVRYHLVQNSAQPTTIGELDGRKSERLDQIALALQHAGFPTAQSENMDAWLKTHVALVSPIANALYLAGGDNYRLSRTRDGLVLMIRAVREGLRVLNALNIPITPSKYRVLQWLPEPLLVAVMKKSMSTQRAELVMARHANAARDEMLQLAEEFRVLARQSGVSTPAIDALFCSIDPSVPILPDGQSKLPVDWRSTAALAAWLAVFTLTAFALIKRTDGNHHAKDT